MIGGNGGKLNNQKILSFIRSETPGKKLADGGGLYLVLLRSGNPVWQIKYRIAQKEKTYSIGPYPSVTLAAARAVLGEVKAQLRENKDPIIQRRISKAESHASSENIFKSVAEAWLAMKRKEWSEGPTKNTKPPKFSGGFLFLIAASQELNPCPVRTRG